MIISDLDKNIVKRWEDNSRKSNTGYITDYFGAKMNINYYQHTAGRSGDVLELPLPSDGVLHEFIEYFGTALALDTNDSGSFTSIEVGAGWGPWIIRSGLLAKRAEIKSINLIGVEADKIHFKWMRQSCKDNNLNRIRNIKIKLHCAAVSSKEHYLYFPKLQNASEDWGAAASLKSDDHDYRGLIQNHKKVRAIPFSDLLESYTKIDLIHIDVQGSEYKIVKSVIRALSRKCRILVIGTHSRKIEGDLLNLFFRNKWFLRAEKCCEFNYFMGSKSLEAMTQVDGTQIWINPRFKQNHSITNY